MSSGVLMSSGTSSADRNSLLISSGGVFSVVFDVSSTTDTAFGSSLESDVVKSEKKIVNNLKPI
jgi:hypothetical protein